MNNTSARGGVFCVIPAYNEAETIVKIIQEAKDLVDEVVVVDDGSTDQTSSRLLNSGAVVLRHIINRGQGAALRTGTEYSLNRGADIIAHFDADGQFLSSDILKIIEPIKQGEAEVVFGSRFLGSQAGINMPFFKKRAIMPLARAVNKLFFKIDLTDPQSGFRAMSRAAAAKVHWRQDRMAHCSEIMFNVKRNNFKMAEVPIKIIYNRFGQSFFDGLEIVKDLFIALLVN